MAVSQKGIQDRAFRIASMTGGEDTASVIIDNQVVFEDYFAIALREACISGSLNENEAAALKRTFDITITNGEGTLDDAVLPECMDQSTLTDDADSSTPISYSPRYGDFLAPAKPNQLSYYTIQGSKLLYRALGDLPGVTDAAVHLTAVALPTIPGTITTAMTIRPETAERVAQILAQKVLGAAAGGQ